MRVRLALLGVTAAALVSTGAFAQTARNDNDLVNNPATRAYDRAAGTDVSGAYPSQADGTPGNPPGTAAGRALDRAAGTNVSGAYPENTPNTR
ncbi:MAG TPA: hypothetical protein VJ779_14545 [Acetobacteraceae bacterium]|nr:hypothetical protein [Acetobacteraceae bacterium]